MTVPEAPLVFHVMAKPTGAVCNLDCEYCFFLSKEMLYPGSRFRMAAGPAGYLYPAAAGSPRTRTGGGPRLAGRRADDDGPGLLPPLHRTGAQRYRRPGQQITHTIQTNGTLLDDDWGVFFAEHGFLAGLSYRWPAGGARRLPGRQGRQGRFGRVMKGLEALKRHEVEWNALTTVHAANAGRGREVYRFLRDELGARFIQFIPIVERATEATAGRRRRWGRGGTARCISRRGTWSPAARSARTSTAGS